MYIINNIIVRHSRRDRVIELHTAVPCLIPGKADRCQPSIVRDVVSYWFVTVILVKKQWLEYYMG